ncbi:hypothetical protein ABPG72_009949 [Tetrahymena utriculariae]
MQIQFIFKYTLEDKFDKNKVKVDSNFNLQLEDITFDTQHYKENYKWDLIATVKEQVIQQKMNLGFFYFYIQYENGFLEYQQDLEKSNQQTVFVFQYNNKSYCGYSTASSYQDKFQLLLKQSLGLNQMLDKATTFNKILLNSYFYCCKKIALDMNQYSLKDDVKKQKWQTCSETILKNVKIDSDSEYFQDNKFKLEHEMYSAQIFFDSIYQLIYHEKKFEMNFEVPISQFNEDMKKNLLKITFIGCYDKGKTFIIDFLEKKNFASSFESITQGQAYYIGKSFICLDQAGIHRAVDLSKMYYKKAQENHKNVKDFLKDKNKIDEIFIIISLKFCNICVLCCDVLTQSDQQLIHVVKKHIKNINGSGQQQKRLIVLHNLKKIQKLYDILQNIYQNIGLAFYRKKINFSFKIFDEIQTIPNSYIFEQLGYYLQNYSNLPKIFKQCSLFIVKYCEQKMQAQDKSKFLQAYKTWIDDQKNDELDKDLLNFFNLNINDDKHAQKQKKFMQFQEKLSLFILLEFFQPIEDEDILHFTACDIKSQYSFEIFEQIRHGIQQFQALAHGSHIRDDFTKWIEQELQKELKKMIKIGKQDQFKLKSQKEGDNKLIFTIDNQSLDLQNDIDLQRDVFSLDEQYQPNVWKENEHQEESGDIKITVIVESMGINNLRIERRNNEFWMLGEKSQPLEDSQTIIQSNAKYGNFKINLSGKYSPYGYYAIKSQEIEQKDYTNTGLKIYELYFRKD